MLGFAFLAVGIYVIVKACKGEYTETACNIALVVGIIAGISGCIVGIATNNGVFVFLNVIVIACAIFIRPAARHLANLYIEKKIADQEALEREIYLHSRYSDPNRKAVYTDDNFDDEELRFGKGGYTDPKL